MNIIKSALLASVTAMALVACQPPTNVGKTLKPVDMKASNVTPGVPYYPVEKAPKGANNAIDASILPPGQDLSPAKKNTSRLM